jgi:hypothetical protein
MNLFGSYLVLGGGLIVSAALFSVAVRLARANRLEAKKSAYRSRSVKDAILGRARMHEDWLPDARVKGGMIYNRSKKRLEISGRLSDDSFDRVFR